MGKKFIWTAAVLTFIAAVPYTALAGGEAGERFAAATESSQSYGPAAEASIWEKAEQALADPEAMNNLRTKYAVEETLIYKTPDENGGTYDTSRVNTSFEVLAESGGWSIITTQSGVAFIRSDALAEEPIEKWRMDYTEEDLYVMAHALAGESQNCSDEEQRYVGSVILNRVAHSSFPGTIKGVVFQKGQYACTRDGNYYREPTEKNWANARWLLENGSVLPANVVWQSGSRQGKGVYIKTAHHYYCY